MDASPIDIFEIYRRYCDIKSEHACIIGEERYMQDSDVQKAKLSREALTQLSNLVESQVRTGVTIFDELSMLMSRVGVMVDFSELSRFYDFVFFMCRENGQKNITVSRAVTAWKLVFLGGFHCFINGVTLFRYNISEDTWQQVLAFSWYTRDSLEGYDREGAWPVLIDDFVEHMYSILSCKISASCYVNSDFHCTCCDPESKSCVFEDPLPEQRYFSGLKRKSPEDTRKNDMEYLNASDDLISSNCKRSRAHGALDWEDNSPGDCMETSRQNSPFCSSNSPCAVEGCLSKGFAGLFSTRSCLKFGRERKASFI